MINTVLYIASMVVDNAPFNNWNSVYTLLNSIASMLDCWFYFTVKGALSFSFYDNAEVELSYETGQHQNQIHLGNLPVDPFSISAIHVSSLTSPVSVQNCAYKFHQSKRPLKQLTSYEFITYARRVPHFDNSEPEEIHSLYFQ